MSYLHVARKHISRKIATFRYNNPHLKPFRPPNPPTPLSMQRHCEIISDTLLETTVDEFQKNGIQLPEFNMIDVSVINSVRIYNENISVDLTFEEKKPPFTLTVSNNDLNYIHDLSKKKAIIEVTHSPCLGMDNCPTGIVVPGQVFM